MSRPLVTTLVVLALAALALPVAAGSAPTNERRAIQIYNHAVGQIFQPRSHCIPPPPDSTETHEAPKQQLLDNFAIVRRPRTDADVPSGRGPMFGATAVYVDYVRLATASNGRQFWVVPARQLTPLVHVRLRCLHRLRADLRRAVRGEKPAVRRRVRSLYVVFARHEHQKQTVEDTIGLMSKGQGGGTAGDIAQAIARGQFVSEGRPERDRSALSGLVPDPVAEITFTFGRRRFRKGTSYPTVITMTVAVQDNVVSLDVPRDPEDAFPSKMVWRDASGRVVKVVDAFQ